MKKFENKSITFQKRKCDVFHLLLVMILLFLFKTASGQDTILLKNGEEIEAKVNEVNQTEVKYRRFDHLDGPVYFLPTSEIEMIKYENKTEDIFEEEEIEPDVTAQIFSSPVPEDIDPRNKDIIITRTGIVIYCFIKKIKDDVLYYQIIRRGGDKDGSVFLMDISAYRRHNVIKKIAPLPDNVSLSHVPQKEKKKRTYINQDDDPYKLFTREFNVSVFGGWAFFGARNSLESQMTQNGFDCVQGGGSYVPTWSTEYPYSKRTPVFDIVTGLFIKPNSGLAFSFGLAEHLRTVGLAPLQYTSATLFTPAQVIDESELILRSTTWAFSLCYMIRTEDKRGNFLIGPALLIHKIQSQGNNSFLIKDKLPASNTNLLPGIYLDFSYHFLQKKYWFMGFKFNLRLAPYSQIGPYTGSGSGNKFDKCSVNVSVLNFGLTVGLRAFKKK